MKTKILTDRNLARKGFHEFAGSARAESGRCIVFCYPSGAKYKVPLEFVLKWVEGFEVDRAVFNGEASSGLWPIPILERVRKLPDPHFVRIYLSDGRRYDVSWDTVLMACEPLYEHYGGLTKNSKELTKEWSDVCGSFRVSQL